jgi:hypothetical protein
MVLISRLFVAALCLEAVTATASMSCLNPQHVRQRLQKPSEDIRSAYQAPLHYCDGSFGDVLKGEYMVLLIPGYSFDDHCRKIGWNMNDYIEAFLTHVYPDRVLYTCTGVADEVLEDIRADPGVKDIFCTTNKLPEPEHFKQQQ